MSRIRISNGFVVDPRNGVNGIKDIYIEDNRIVTSLPSFDTDIDASGCYVLPGLIDFHCHLYEGSAFGFNPELLLPTGVTSAVDAGTAGYINYEEFYRTVVKRTTLTVKTFINISPIGQPGAGVNEPLQRELINKETLRAVVDKHRDAIIGLKVRISKSIVGSLGLDPLKHALELGEELGLPVNVHITNPPEKLSEVVKYFRKGDIFTHVFEGTGHTIIEDGHVAAEIKKAKERGVIFDSANGRSNFVFTVAEKALSEGFYPDVISTDSTVLNFNKPYVVKNLPFIMSKYLSMGMKLEDIVKAVTATPAQLMGESERLGHIGEGAASDVAICRIKGKEVLFRDTLGDERKGKKVIEPVMVLKNGEYIYTSPDFS